MKKQKHITIKSFDEFENELRFLPEGITYDFKPKNALEGHFFDAAEKHGIMDEMIDGDYEE